MYKKKKKKRKEKKRQVKILQEVLHVTISID